MLTRRGFLTGAAVTVGGVAGLSSYALAIEPMWRLNIVRHTIALPDWPADAPPMTAALIADIHIIDPWMSLDRVAGIVATANDMKPDITLLLGDYASHMKYGSHPIAPLDWSPVLAGLRAPLGVHAILGNHDHWRPFGARDVSEAVTRAGINLIVNDAIHIEAGGRRFWLAGTDSLYATGYVRGHRGPFAPLDRMMATTLRRTQNDRDPVILMAHEPTQFHWVPQRVSLTLSGHTHGGQVRLPFIGAPILRNRERYDYGLFTEDKRQLFVSAGLGCSIVPVRFLMPPEIVLLTIGPAAKTA